MRALRLVRRTGTLDGLVTHVTMGGVLERLALDSSPPRLEPATVIEGAALAARRLDGQPLPGFAAFLDGVQASRVLAHGEDGAPVVHGTVAAVVRVRVDRRLVTWVGAPLSRARSTCQMATSSRRDLMGFVRTEST